MVLGPRLAGLLQLARVFDGALDLILELQDLESETHGHVPADVAVHQPSTGIVDLETNDEVAAHARGIAGHHRRVTARRVLGVEDNARVELTTTRSENEKVVAVEMNGVWQWNHALDDDVDPLAPFGSLEHEVAAVGWDSVVLIHGEQSGVCGMTLEGGTAQEPSVKTGLRETVGAVNDDVEGGPIVAEFSASDRVKSDNGNDVGIRLVDTSLLVAVGGRVGQ